MLFLESKEKVSIKDRKDICFKLVLSITLHFININYVNCGNTHIMALIQLTTKYIDIVFKKQWTTICC